MKKEKELRFWFRGELYRVDSSGRINANGIGHFSDQWVFRGGAPHHFCTKPTIDLAMAFENPNLLNGCMGFDIDNGTYREWGGNYNGKLARITGAYISTKEGVGENAK